MSYGRLLAVSAVLMAASVGANAALFDLSGSGEQESLTLISGDITLSITADVGNLTRTANGLGLDATGINPGTGFAVNDFSAGLDNTGFDDFIRIEASHNSDPSAELILKSITFSEWGGSGSDVDSVQILSFDNYSLNGTSTTGSETWLTPAISLNGGVSLVAAGESANGGSDFRVLNLEIVEASAVPVPAAVWLFGSALLGLFGIRRRRR